MTSERWTTRRLSPRGGGAREGWWGVSDSANVFLDQLVVWRELAFNGCAWMPRYMDYQSFPAWARETLEAHRSDPRRQHAFETLESAATHDPIWNATQRQLLAEGWFHGYLRMLWGKKILEWAPDPPTALAWMEALMNRYSLDGRDPDSYAGFAWVLGRYDRPWPARPVFGTVRYMSSDSAKRKLRMTEFLKKYGRQRHSRLRLQSDYRSALPQPNLAGTCLCAETPSAGVRGSGLRPAAPNAAGIVQRSTMTDGTKNLMVARGEKSVWDKPGLGATLSTYDQERWVAAAWGSVLAMLGARRGGFIGGLLAMAGLVLTVRAAMGRRDFSMARECVDRTLRDRGWRPKDIVGETSDESFPASDSPSWTATSGARANK